METGTQKYRALVMAADSGSIASAAAHMGYSISSVSRMVSDLETECGFPLLERSKFGVKPTSDGARMIACARRILAECDLFEATAREIAGIEGGTVRVGTFSSIATHWLPNLLGEFAAEHPQIEYELLMGDYSEITSWIDEGRVDIGFLREPIDARLESTSILKDELMAVLPKDHPMADAKAFPLTAFENEPFISIERGGDAEGPDLFARHGLHVSPAFSTWDDYAIMAMVEAGLGIAMLPALILRRCAYDLAMVPLDVPARRDIWVTWKASRPLPIAAHALLDLIRERADTNV